jgi:hypothetical protein
MYCRLYSKWNYKANVPALLPLDLLATTASIFGGFCVKNQQIFLLRVQDHQYQMVKEEK